MPSRPPLYYWDACVALSWVNGDADRIADLDAMLAEAARGEITLVSSVLSVAEVAFAASERTGRVLDDDELRKIDTLWAPVGQIKLIEFQVLIAEEARTIQRLGIPDGLVGLRSVDAMHLATARLESVDAFHTYDGKLKRLAPWATKVGFPIAEPLPTQPALGLPA